MAACKQKTIGFSFLNIAILVLCTIESRGDEACDKWAQMAKSMTSRLQNCTNQSQVCTRLDCKGSISFNMFSRNLLFDYCFGTQLNSCSDPVSVDFYLQVPARNVTLVTNINQDELVDIPGIAIPLGIYGEAVPKLLFHFEKANNGNILYWVKLLAYVGDNVFYQHTLVDNETIHAQLCSGKTAPPNFNTTIGQCHSKNISVSSTPAPTAQPYVPSATLNKRCDGTSLQCSHLEMCSMSKKMCQCLPEALLTPANDACLSRSRLGNPCSIREDCGLYEQCSDVKVCKCEDGYFFRQWQGSCVFGQPDGLDKGNNVTVPEAHNTDSGVNSDDLMEKHNVPIIVGVSLAGAILVGLLVWLAMRYQFSRRRQHLSISSDESRAPMLGGQDDDNLIM